MTDSKELSLARRKFLKLVSSGALAVPVVGLTACGGDSGSSAPQTAAPAATPQTEPAAETNPTGAAAAAEMPILSPSDPQASALGYVEDANDVDASKYPQYADGQLCANCALYTVDGVPFGPCSIFPGRHVNANGWCGVYAPKA